MRDVPPRGFRFDLFDGVLLAAAAAATWLLWSTPPHFELLVPVVVLHFFLFCNVFRVRAAQELIWTAGFLPNFTLWVVSGEFTWLGVLACQTPVTLAVLAWAIWRPGY